MEKDQEQEQSKEHIQGKKKEKKLEGGAGCPVTCTFVVRVTYR